MNKPLSTNPDIVVFRVYADGSVVHEDDFAEKDNDQPYLDDYTTYMVPYAILEHMQAEHWSPSEGWQGMTEREDESDKS